MNENPMVAAKADYWDLDFPKKKLHFKVLICVLFGQGVLFSLVR